MSQNLPLTGIRVIDYSHFLAGPHMSRCLAAMGADVSRWNGRRVVMPASCAWLFQGRPIRLFQQQNMGKQGPLHRSQGQARSLR